MSDFFDERSHYQQKNLNNRATRFWGSQEGQHLRFSALRRHINFSGRSLLDVGCGVADLFGYLHDQKISLESYTGIDITPEFINEAQQKFPNEAFILGDVCSCELPPYDVAVCVGIFGHAQPEDLWLKRFDLVIERLFEDAGSAVACTLTSTQSEKRNSAAHYVDPQFMMSHIAKWTKKYVIDHSYLPNDFLLVLYK